MEYRDNEVIFASTSNKLVKGSFTVSQFSVTDGQDPKGHIYAGFTASCGSDGKFSFSIGRKGSKTVADWFSARVPGNKTTFNHKPDELNFAMIGTLVLEFSNAVCTFYNVALAQGHAGASNNWWFGGQQAMYNGSDSVIYGALSNGLVQLVSFQRGGNDVNEVKVAPRTF
ncbi:hypothetical protein [Chryseobacterium populi]|uniref:Uncharacterized protein n=1 Tax=Chryseobacterium populi TaxID=1144316 RepID=J2K3P6_9FLAO|nr:hypothetical protein [Chryseobacterium populi]EJL74800.1 hypothetical protein PMI13_00679 [Chryseobacterium populi]